jgi:hypothetical protein
LRVAIPVLVSSNPAAGDPRVYHIARSRIHSSISPSDADRRVFGAFGCNEVVPDSSRSPTATFLAALDVERNAKRGFALGGALALVVLIVFVFLPGTSRPTTLYLLLAVVLATSAGALATVALVLLSAYRLSQEL